MAEAEVLKLSELTDMQNIAIDLSTLLALPCNADIAAEFPATVDRYTGNVDAVTANLCEAQESCNPFTREIFLIFAGEQAVGLSVVRLTPGAPEGISTNMPNVSYLICHPWRRRGLGRLSLQTQLDHVNQYFDGKAWTKIKKTNEASRRLALSQGFMMAPHLNENEIDDVYVYTDSSVT